MLATNTKTITKEDAVITKDDWAVLQIIRENPSVSAEEIDSRLGLTRAGAIYCACVAHKLDLNITGLRWVVARSFQKT